ncbi:helix-turn-helix domain-containing protein [Limnohabitans sp.]|jgi:cytoskeleton protein RodZ|uniref:helix-turn-helix domain-containing protein n=1 Tax=Limnohabitans sp. TaxID=1907725 RepID=UPI002FDDC5AB
MTEDTPTFTTPSTTAGDLLRQYREAHGAQLDVLAQTLRVAPAKLEALEADRLDELPDAMFARALALAVCRQLKVDAATVLALLPNQDVSRLAPKNERGLDFPLDRPSFLPQSNFLAVTRILTPMRWAALVVLALALMIGLWPEIHGLLVFKDQAAAATLVEPVARPTLALPSSQELPPVLDLKSGQMVLTTVHSAAVTAQAASAAIPASASGVSYGK